jgi:hypothetical protein
VRSSNPKVAIRVRRVRPESRAAQRVLFLVDRRALADGPREGGPFRVEVVGATGLAMWNGLAESTPAGVQVKVLQQLGQGDYFLRLFAGSGKVIHEYGFRVRP